MDNERIAKDAFHLCQDVLRLNLEEGNQGTASLCISIEPATLVGASSQVSAASVYYSYTETPFYLEERGILKISPHTIGATSPSEPKGFKLVTFDIDNTQAFVNEMTKQFSSSRIIFLPSNWKWFDEKEGIYQFGERKFQRQGSKIRKKVFQALMNTFESNHDHIIGMDSLAELTGEKHARLRIEIGGINKWLRLHCGLEFKGSGKGYYYLQKYSKHPEN